MFTNVALTDDGDVWWEGMTDDAPGAPDRLAGQGLDAGHRQGNRRQGRAPECALHRGSGQQPGARPRMGQRLPAVAIDAFIFGGRRSTTVPLVTRGSHLGRGRLHGRHDGQRDHRRSGRPAGRGAPRSVRDAAIRRLQHGRSLPALAEPR
ncbi:MAG: phosphoenolpyruvate carboxykinase domain-containing protein [Burkholderiaceae bacterium]